MRTRSVAAALLIAFAPLTMSVPGLAQNADDPSVKAARARFNEGVEFFDKGQFENARASFLQAYALRKHPAVLENLAQSSLRSGHTLDAAKYFQQYLRESSTLTAAQRADAEKGLAEARTKLGRLEVSAAGGAEVFVDGEHVGTAPLTDAVDVDPGTHTVKANSDSKSVSVNAGQILPVKFTPGGGGGAVGVVVAPIPTIPSGDVTPAPPTGDSQVPPTPPPPSDTGPGLFSPPRSMAPVWIGVGVGVAGAATAILFGVFKGQANTSYESLIQEISAKGGTSGTCTNTPSSSRFFKACQSLVSDQNQVNSDATAANIGIIAGSVGLAFGLGWYLFAPKRDAKDTAAPTSSFVPIIEPHMNGLGYTGTF
jgi:Tfp pilus assembly protein PilF